MMDKKPKTKQDWDAEWQERTLHYLLLQAIRNEAKEQLIEETLRDTDYEGYKKRYFAFLDDRSEALKKLKATPGGESPLPDT